MISSVSGSMEAPKLNTRWWSSARALCTSVGGLIGAAGLILAIRRDGMFGSLSYLSGFPGPRHVPSEEYVLPGLRNHGNHCYLNVILQALAACTYFQPFLEEILEEALRLSEQGVPANLPLTESLDALLVALQTLSAKTEASDPIGVMEEMSEYTSGFNLMVQQDTVEALGLLINYLREESLSCYVRDQTPLIPSDGRMLSLNVANGQSVQERWHNHFIGPFDGMNASIVTCHTCFSQLSLSFEFFYTLTLPVAPMHDRGVSRDCNLYHCLRQFAAASRENTHCSSCWHIAAATYLSSIGKSQGDAKKVKACTMLDSCECKSLSSLRNFTSNCKVSGRTRIARAPKILCLQLERGVYRAGHAYKLQGHVAFNFVLDISPFMLSGYGVNMEGNLYGHWMQQRWDEQVRLSSAPSNPQADRRQPDLTVHVPADGSNRSVQEHWTDQTRAEGCSTVNIDICSGSEDKMIRTPKNISKASPLYRLVAVLEQIGELEHGHYTIFRRVATNPPKSGQPQKPNQVPVRWFHISDGNVRIASEAEVLAAHACMLYYERIPDEEKLTREDS